MSDALGELPPPQVAWLVCDGRVLASLQIATSARARMRGLLGRPGLEGAMLLEHTRWVHTIGMRFPVDVAYIDRHGTVLRVERLERHRVGRPVPRATAVIEAEAGALVRWDLKPGHIVEIRR
jgi:uncharacterized membrane protein (UPF0127 family)